MADMFHILIHIRKSFKVQMESRQWWNGKVQEAACIHGQKIRSYCLYLNNPFPCIVTAATPLFYVLGWDDQLKEYKRHFQVLRIPGTFQITNVQHLNILSMDRYPQGKRNTCYWTTLLLLPLQCFFFQSYYRYKLLCVWFTIKYWITITIKFAYRCPYLYVI